jgi:hypothetical protein
MTRKSMLAAAVALAAMTAGFAAPVASPDDDHRGRSRRRLKAELRGTNEVPAVSTQARGSFHGLLSRDETQIEYVLHYAGLTGAVTQAHIHLGDHHTNGGVSVFLCANAGFGPPAGTPAPPPCPQTTLTDPPSGTLTATHVFGPAGQGISVGEFAELVKAIKSGVTYVNVHTTTFGGGEIRGEVAVY